MLSDKSAKTIQWRMNSVFNKMVLDNCISMCKRKTLDALPHMGYELGGPTSCAKFNFSSNKVKIKL